MSFYRRHVLPVLTHLAMSNQAVTAERGRWIPLAAGVVLEIGAGSGLNLAFYGPRVCKLYALEPSDGLRRMTAPRARHAGFPVETLAASAEAIPLPAASVEWVVTTWTLCTIETRAWRSRSSSVSSALMVVCSSWSTGVLRITRSSTGRID